MKLTFKCSCGRTFPDRKSIVEHEKQNPGHEGAMILEGYNEGQRDEAMAREMQNSIANKEY